MDSTTLRKSDWVDFIGLGAIGLYALFSAPLGSNFSELHLSFSFLNFPVFIGEILMAFCFVLLCVRHRLRPVVWSRWQKAMWIYLILIVFKALWDLDHYHSPLALRNAALFYYPFFAVFASVFYNPRLFSSSFCILAALVLGFLTSVFNDIAYYWMTGVVLFFMAWRRIQPVKARLLMIVLFLIFCHYRLAFAGSRTNLVGAVIAIGFLMCVYLFYFLNIPARKKFWISVTAVLVLACGVFIAGDKNGIKSIVKLVDLRDMYLENEKQIKIMKSEGWTVVILTPIQLYNDNRRPNQNIQDVHISRTTTHPSPVVPKGEVSGVSAGKGSISRTAAKPLPVVPKGEVSGISNGSPPRELPARAAQPAPETWLGKIVNEDRGKSVANAQSNMLFRFYIWRDMFRELVHGPDGPHWFGVGLGKPQRSPTLEMLNWGLADWGRDGWIAPHNTYFHVIYRFGLLGLALIFVVFFSWGRLLKLFIDQKLFQGIALLAVLLYWLTATSFLVILELPHYAIPFWTIWGVALAYADEKSPYLRG